MSLPFLLLYSLQFVRAFPYFRGICLSLRNKGSPARRGEGRERVVNRIRKYHISTINEIEV